MRSDETSALIATLDQDASQVPAYIVTLEDTYLARNCNVRRAAAA